MRMLARALIVAVALAVTTFVDAQTFDLVIANGRVIDPESGSRRETLLKVLRQARR